MVKRGMVAAILMVCITGVTACSGSIDTAAVELPTEGQKSIMTEDSMQEEQEEGTLTTQEDEKAAEAEGLQKVRIYYGNGTAAGLKSEEVTLSEVSPETILGLLGRHNIVSIDTKAQSFDDVDDNGKRILKLDLSKQFKDYIGMMGTDGEYIVMAGLVNTFLDIYDADALVLTVAGKNLETGHNIYDKPLKFFKINDDSKEINDLSYQLSEEVITTENASIVYPQFINMKNEKLMAQWNENIREAATANYREEEVLEYSVKYEITTQNAGMVSVILRGDCNYKGAAHPYQFKSTFNFDLTTGKNKRLKEYADIEEIAKCLEGGYGYKILNEGIEKEDLTAYLTDGFIDDYAKLLQDYDYDFSNKNLIPTGFSYIKEDQTLVLVLEVNHAMGDYLEIEID